MAAPQTYSELQAAIARWMVRDDLADDAPAFIGMAESRFNRILRVPEMETDATATVSTGLFTLPTDFLAMRSVYVNGTSRSPLEQMGLAQLQEMYGGESSGCPRHFALQGGGEMVLGPPPSGPMTLLLNYYQKIPALSDTNTSNWLLLAHPDLYLAASLVEGFMLTRDASAVQGWEARTSAMLSELTKQGIKRAYGAAPLVRSARSVA